jgi:GntR family transcriptional regulator/MocR family aminotransferase
VFLRHPTLEGSLRYDFIGGATSKGQFPQDDWRRCTSHALRQISASKGFYSLPKACQHCAMPSPGTSRFRAGQLPG